LIINQLLVEAAGVELSSVLTARKLLIPGTATTALTVACPGPLFALVGDGVTVMIVAIVSALAGTWLYGVLRPKLPH
jgi:hypothetical protein